MKKILFVLMLIGSIPTFSTAQEACGEFNYEEMEYASVAKITGAANSKAYFYASDGDCMSNNTCKKAQFLIPNDYVLVSSPTDYSACGLYVSRAGVETKGWLKGRNVGYNLTPAKAQWNGTWQIEHGNTITLRVTGSNVSAKGTASLRDRTGAFSGRGTIADGILSISDGDCGVRMAFLGTRLYVVDNNQCGGLNVSFTGSYKK